MYDRTGCPNKKHPWLQIHTMSCLNSGKEYDYEQTYVVTQAQRHLPYQQIIPSAIFIAGFKRCILFKYVIGDGGGLVIKCLAYKLVRILVKTGIINFGIFLASLSPPNSNGYMTLVKGK